MRDIETTAVLVTVTPTVVMVVVVEYVVGVVVGYDESGGVDLIRSEWREYPLERRKPIR